MSSKIAKIAEGRLWKWRVYGLAVVVLFLIVQFHSTRHGIDSTLTDGSGQPSLKTFSNGSGLMPLENGALLKPAGRSDPRFFVRWHAAQALWKVDPSQCKRIVPILTEGLDNPILESHLSARTLIEIGPDARLAVPELLNILSDPEPYVRVHAAEAIGRISPDRTGIKAVLHENLDSSDPFTRYVAARGLCNLLACADSLFPVLGDLVHDSNPAIRTGANVTTYSNTGLLPATTYYYRVRASDACGNNSAYSNTAPFPSPTIMFIPSLRFRRGKANPQFRCGNLASATPVFLSKVRKRWRFDAWNVHVR
ncbi:MAG: HEAT repeat domain-containing protein [Verrucomicrobia bacterium]|nr:HEAT repeat domain-containing protein [Verrucomicrobiota bacterium]